MKLCGLQKTTLLDYPGHVAATIFSGGCNFRCPYCHNSGLIYGNAQVLYTEAELFDFLKKRKGILEGVCITGGEPTLQTDLEPFIKKIKSLGYLIKLDTNGYQPEILKRLVSEGVIHYVAMDIKAGRNNYENACGITNINMKAVEESARFLMEGHVLWEFRTTVVKGIHTEEDFSDIALWLQGPSSYFLQSYVDSDEVLCGGLQAFSKHELEHFLRIVQPSIPNVSLRGIDT
ncbi:anaerobic ribonucleoside-triphosphate reductase activating protein [Clostridium sp. HBUAS56010]|uniref:anaerobic ribonucleoside-triphosphate reductase activating protein n=1 Tax=Clostridium sp. HBUAS56010 TaxID=2571127 RepID=UPI0011787499|nr:anaerobic ribonucleoside-triphosphate reductase activating protein [Clostridium sp. HBUAS56010]